MLHVNVRPATTDDIPQAVTTLTNAFEHYAFIWHTIAGDNFVQRLNRYNEHFVREIGLPHGRVGRE